MIISLDWCNFAQKPKKSIPPKYIITYFIRGLNPTAQREEKRLAEEKELVAKKDQCYIEKEFKGKARADKNK